ncbi:SDR family NAD(P)-dependent oxidoreductase [Haliea sp. E1-2-M8]|uniref:SDR family NAD(P)-dependent oxidoreductase n=1 Tax=Haliea sp. E1-2-M8 TaxID=3064706 RepID=UPI00271AF54F|nr:SDR family NAD(P)-dependent oxidoreductase [Haliea sp. E1-2-M8]MDO8860695.1 SDR family NAD(P)-dependent oxidoreductase [Haliea sp. E1-2-M8]
MKNLFDISGKVAVVTGGSRGIGAMIAEGFVANGVRTYITARREDELQATAAELSQQGECIALAADLSTADGVTRFAAEIREREPALHILVNNAGATWGASVDEFPENGWDKVMDLNVKSIFFLTQQLLPALRAAGTDADPARVINIGSVNGITNSHMQNYSYTASKAAVHHLTRHLGAELARERVNVNAIAPGLFPSKMTAHMAGHEEELTRAFPISRMGSPEDAAGTAIYLSARASAWVTGHVLVLDGGLVAVS